MREVMGQPGQRLLTATENLWRVRTGRKIKSFVTATTRLIITLIKSSLSCRERVLSWHVIHYGPRPGFSYYSLNIPIETPPYPPPRDLASSSVGLSIGNLHQYTGVIDDGYWIVNKHLKWFFFHLFVWILTYIFGTIIHISLLRERWLKQRNEC